MDKDIERDFNKGQNKLRFFSMDKDLSSYFKTVKHHND